MTISGFSCPKVCDIIYNFKQSMTETKKIVNGFTRHNYIYPRILITIFLVLSDTKQNNKMIELQTTLIKITF